jgi:CelD/BcsL family acetyltransferase involved in cellulose biosynthesis
MLTVRDASPAELARWDDIVRQFDNWRIVHTRVWVEWLGACGHGRPLYLILEQDGEIVGCLPGLLGHLGFLRLFGSPPPGAQTPSMGPAFDRGRVSTQSLIAAALPYLEQRHRVHHVEVMTSDFDPVAMQSLGFRGLAEPTYRAPLVPGDAARYLKTWKDSARRNVRRAEKLGLIARFEEHERFVDDHYAQIRDVFIRGGHSISFTRDKTREFFRRMHAAGKLMAISIYLPDGETNIATGLFKVDGKELLLWSWAHDAAYRWYRPTEFLTWHVARRAIEAGCETFDFMGLGDFKAKFGAEVDHTKYRWVRSRYFWLVLARTVAAGGYRWQQVVRGRLARLRLASSHVADAERDDAASVAAQLPPVAAVGAVTPQRRRAP